jgi:hypothetical protein
MGRREGFAEKFCFLRRILWLFSNVYLVKAIKSHKELAMKRTVVRYKTKPEHADENARLIEQVFAELKTKAPEGARYLVLRLADGSFIHIVGTETADGVSPIPRLEAFQAFQSGIKERCAEPPQSSEAVVVGNYRMIDA